MIQEPSSFPDSSIDQESSKEKKDYNIEDFENYVLSLLFIGVTLLISDIGLYRIT